MGMKVLIGMETSGHTRDAFIALGHDAMSCDFLPSKKPGPHYQGDVFDVINDGWDLAIFHPTCTWVCVSGLHWNKRGRQGLTPAECEIETQKAIDFAEKLWNESRAKIKRVALENPISCLSTRSILGKPKGDRGQVIQPHQFGHDASKATCIWRHQLPALVPTLHIPPRIVRGGPHDGKKRWSNQTDSGQNKLPPSADRWQQRSETYPGISQAMAEQWGIL